MFVRILLWFVVLLRLVLLFLRFVLRGWGMRVQLTNTAGAGVA
ncbi:hypothetical protein [Streptomyces sp. H27-H5]|nr:hypothetical protein [Streptomyces sp. H27-H5]MCY0956860.1 hypothetical protein [Streptomyces sp. H27-H5]